MVGDLNQEAMSGGCPVTLGEKWLATSWINIIGDGDLELRAWRRGKNWIANKDRYPNIFDTLGTSEPKLVYEDYEREFHKESDGDNRTVADESRAHYIHKPESNKMKALNALLEDMTSDQLKEMAKHVHEKLSITCIPLTMKQDGQISLVDGSRE